MVALVTFLSLVAVVVGRPAWAQDDPTTTTSTTPVDVAPVEAPLAEVDAPDFGFSAAPPLQTMAPGSATGFLVRTTSLGGFTTAVKLTATNVPTGVTATFAPSTVAPGLTSILSLTSISTAPPGTFTITVTGTAGTTVHTTTVQLKLDFGLVEQCTVKATGTVRENNAGAAPIAGAVISGGGKNTVTDANGKYELAGLPLGPNNKPVSITVNAAKDPPKLNHIGRFWTKSSSQYGVCGEPLALDFNLTPVLTAQLRGKVVEGEIKANDYAKPVPKANAAPIANATVPVPGGIATTLTDASGNFSFKDDENRPGLHLGLENAAIPGPLDPVRGPTTAPVGQRYWNSVKVPFGPLAAGNDKDVGTIPLVKQCTAALTGQIIDSATDKPINGVNVVVKATDNLVTDTFTDTTELDGTFTIPAVLFGFNNEPGTLKITATRTAWKPATFTTTEASCGAAVVADFTMDPVDGNDKTIYDTTISGRVVDEDTKAPVAGIKVSPCGTVGGCETSTATTDAQGKYTIGWKYTTTDDGPTGPAYMQAAVSTNYWGGRVDFTVNPVAVTAPDLLLKPKKFGSATGIVTDSVTNLPLQNVAMSTNATVVGTCTTCKTDATGKYTIPKVSLLDQNKDKEATITATLTGYWTKTKDVTYTAAGPVTAPFALVKKCDGSTVTGKVVAAGTQAPIAGATVSGGTKTATTDAQGNYTLLAVPPGPDNTPLDVTFTAKATGFYDGKLSAQITCRNANDPIVLNFGFAPVVSSLTPTSGPTSGGTRVTIKGTDLAGATQVLFGDVAGTDLVQRTVGSGFELDVTSPPNVAGDVYVKVVTPGGVSGPSTGSKFTYVPAAPGVSSVLPATGPVDGGTVVTITGTNLAGATGVSFGDTPAAAFSVISPTSVSATSPPGSGTVNVIVTTLGGSSLPSEGSKFTYTTTTSTSSSSTSTSSTSSSTSSTSSSSTSSSTSSTSTSSTSTSSTSSSTSSTSTSSTSTSTTSTTSSTTSTTKPTTTTTTTTIKPPTTTTTIPPTTTATVVVVLVWLVWLLICQCG